MDPITILAALAPLLVDGGKALIGKFIGTDFKPANVADYLAIQRAELEKFAAVNAAGGMNPSYPWVEAVVRLQRPIVGAAVLGIWAWSKTYGVPSESIDNFASAIGFYLFGDRTLFHIKAAKK
jgi:hypothetical protein